MLHKFLNLLTAQFGLDLRRLLQAFVALPGYLLDLRYFRKASMQRLVINPQLHDRESQGGTARSEYFWQDLYVARKIFEANPKKHVDVGSRFDGFVAHVASYREIEVIDVRPIDTTVPGVTFRRLDMTADHQLPREYTDSVSCLHALEHFGLGRYGDPIDAEGHTKGLKNIADLLRDQGRLYLSTPIGEERVEFNANRVLCPKGLVQFASTLGLKLVSLSWVIPDKGVIESIDTESDLDRLRSLQYTLGIFVFIKREQPPR